MSESSSWAIEDFEALSQHFLRSGRFIDVRAPLEFAAGHLPGAMNLPLLTDEERHKVGIVYAQDGSEAALALGHQLVCGSVKEQRIQEWSKVLKTHPDAILYCARGGLRSQISQGWLRDLGIQVHRWIGGYKSARSFLLQELRRLPDSLEFLVVVGATGGGKTELLRNFSTRITLPVVDLEGLARHRGSAFGSTGEIQPSQALFENRLAVALLCSARKIRPSQKVLVEDESRLIGRCLVPTELFAKMQSSPAIWLEEPLEVRVKRIFIDYVLNTAIGRGQDLSEKHIGAVSAVFTSYKAAVTAISKKLGGVRASEILLDLDRAEKDFRGGGQTTEELLSSHETWIEKLLTYYYDPLYESQRSGSKPILFKGNLNECVEFLSD